MNRRRLMEHRCSSISTKYSHTCTPRTFSLNSFCAPCRSLMKSAALTTKRRAETIRQHRYTERPPPATAARAVERRYSMFWTTRGMVAALVWVALAGTVSAQEVQTPERAIPNQYIVVLNDERVGARRGAGGGRSAGPTAGRRACCTTTSTRCAASRSRMSATGAAALARNPRVRYVEQDSVMAIVATQTDATWGLDRIDQRDLPLNGTYTYNTTAANVHAYIIDTGIRRDAHGVRRPRVDDRLHGHQRRQRHQRLQRPRHACRRRRSAAPPTAWPRP